MINAIVDPILVPTCHMVCIYGLNVRILEITISMTHRRAGCIFGTFHGYDLLSPSFLVVKDINHAEPARIVETLNPRPLLSSVVLTPSPRLETPSPSSKPQAPRILNLLKVFGFSRE